MISMPASCQRLAADLVAAATGEAAPVVAARVDAHVERCGTCRDEYARYRAIDRACAGLRTDAGGNAAEARARAALVGRLADLRHRLVWYRVFPSPLGNLLIARSELGVTLVEYLGTAASLRASRLGRASGLEPVEDGEHVETLYRDLLEYLAGRRATLDWTVDLGLARGEFHRRVLAVTAAIPYGAVTSYAAIARDVGQPSAARAVAQALRWNPVPIAIPCHRVIGASGSLTGYAGHRVGLKQHLLGVEGVRVIRVDRDLRVPRQSMYVSPRGDGEYCLPTCGGLPQRSLAELTLFGSCQRAEAAGLRPCAVCRPDLHPLPA